MNRRQRKKRRLGEFRELGFELRFRTPDAWTDQERNGFWDACIECMEALGLAVGGGTGRCWDVFVTSASERASVMPEQRQALLDWFEDQAVVSDVRAGDLEDAWH